jgi:hypothetical protein
MICKLLAEAGADEMLVTVRTPQAAALPPNHFILITNGAIPLAKQVLVSAMAL